MYLLEWNGVNILEKCLSWDDDLYCKQITWKVQRRIAWYRDEIKR
jgi:hypothetical protein